MGSIVTRSSIRGVAAALSIALGLALTPRALADTLSVPADYATIQEAIDAAVDGDVVLVAAGTYLENLDFGGMAITVRSDGGAEDTILDGSDPVDPDFGSVVTFASGEGSDSVLSGFTITGGSGTYSGFGILYEGGGIYANGAAPTLEECIIAGNSASSGAGIHAEETPAGEALALRDSVVASNTGASFGCGLDLTAVEADLTDCRIEDNIAVFTGGGFYVQYSEVRLERCEIRANGAGPGWNGAGGIFVGTDVTFRECEIVGNTGGGIAHDGGAILLDHCLVAGNSTTGSGGGLIGSLNSDTIAIEYSTFADNSALSGAAGFYLFPTYSADVTIHGSIFWNNDGGDISSNAGTTVDYTLAEDGIAGDGNIDGDPLFRDPESGDYSLTTGSPCIDTGDPDDPLDPDGTVADLGAFYFEAGAPRFKRGDADGSGSVSGLLDALFVLGWTFSEGPAPPCMAAADVDGNGAVSSLIDALALLQWAFGSGDEPPAPGPYICGEATDTTLGCDDASACE